MSNYPQDLDIEDVDPLCEDGCKVCEMNKH